MNRVIDVCPLNGAQEWLKHTNAGNPRIDTVTNSAIRISGAIDMERFENALISIVAKYDALRMVIEEDETGNFLNKVVDECEVKLNIVKLSDGTPEEKEEEMIEIGNRIGHSIGAQDRKSVFDFTLFELGENEYIFLITVLHLVTDGISNTAIIGEVVALYNGAQTPPVTKDFMSTIRDYHKLRNSEEGKEQTEFWRKRTEGYNESFITFAKDGHGHFEPLKNLTILPMAEMTSFSRKNKTGNGDVAVFLFHLAIAAIFGTDFTMVDSTTSNRTIETRATVGCVVSADFTTLEYDNAKTLPELFRDFKERNKVRDKSGLATQFASKTSFMLSYINYYNGNSNSAKIKLGENATVEPYMNFVYKKAWSYFAMICGELPDKLLIKCGYDPDVFTPEMIEKLSAYLHSGLKCLAEDSIMTFGEFRKLH